MNIWIVTENKDNYSHLKDSLCITFFDNYEQLEDVWKNHHMFIADFILFEDRIKDVTFLEFAFSEDNAIKLKRNKFLLLTETDDYDLTACYYRLGATLVHYGIIPGHILLATLDINLNRVLNPEGFYEKFNEFI